MPLGFINILCNRVKNDLQADTNLETFFGLNEDLIAVVDWILVFVSGSGLVSGSGSGSGSASDGITSDSAFGAASDSASDSESSSGSLLSFNKIFIYA